MNQSEYMPTAHSVNHSDLARMIRLLWNKKWWILLGTFCVGLIAGIYAFSVKEKWTSAAEVVPSKLIDLDGYLMLRKEYERIVDKDVNVGEISNQMFSKFDLLLNSADERAKFFLESELYLSMAEPDNQGIDHKVLHDLVETRFSIVKPDPKKEPNVINRKIYFSADEPEVAQYNLEQLITYLDTTAYQLEVEELLVEVRERILDLKYEKQKFERDLSIQHNVRLSNLNYALETARLAGVKEYLKPVEGADNSIILSTESKIPLTESKISDGAYLFVLGEKYLKAQIDVLTSRGIIYPPRYYQINMMLLELEPLVDKIKLSKAKTIRYQASPTLPTERDKPNRSLIVLLGLIMGFVFSTSFILFRDILGINRLENEKSI